MREGHRVDPDRLIDDELDARQTNPVVRELAGAEGQVGVREVDHDARRRARKCAEIASLDLVRNLAGVHTTGFHQTGCMETRMLLDDMPLAFFRRLIEAEEEQRRERIRAWLKRGRD